MGIDIRPVKVAANGVDETGEKTYRLEYEFFATDNPDAVLIRKTAAGTRDQIESSISAKYRKFKEAYYREQAFLDIADAVLSTAKDMADSITITLPPFSLRIAWRAINIKIVRAG